MVGVLPVTASPGTPRGLLSPVARFVDPEHGPGQVGAVEGVDGPAGPVVVHLHVAEAARLPVCGSRITVAVATAPWGANRAARPASSRSSGRLPTYSFTGRPYFAVRVSFTGR